MGDEGAKVVGMDEAMVTADEVDRFGEGSW